jgi:hypothetical protein
MTASLVDDNHSSSVLNRRQRCNQLGRRSTIHRLGLTVKPMGFPGETEQF